MSDVDTEAEALRQLLGGREKKSFAESIRLPGGASMLSQHLSGNRPMSLEAATCYAAGFKVSLESISPRWATAVRLAASMLDNSAPQPVAPLASPHLPDLPQALAAVVGRLPGLDAYTANKLMTAVDAAIKGTATLEVIEADLLALLQAEPSKRHSAS